MQQEKVSQCSGCYDFRSSDFHNDNVGYCTRHLHDVAFTALRDFFEREDDESGEFDDGEP